MRTRITEQLHIEYPVFQGAMAWIADGYLAASGSNAGGLGVIAGGAAPIEVIWEEVKKAKSMTDKPFALNIMLLSPNADDVAQLVIDEKIPVVTTGAGSPSKYIQQWKQAGTAVIPVVASVALALLWLWRAAWSVWASMQLLQRAWSPADTLVRRRRWLCCRRLWMR